MVHYPTEVEGWNMCKSSKRSDRPGANYEDPTRERVYINIIPPDNKETQYWIAKYNPHTGEEESEIIAKRLFEEDIVVEAVRYMENNPVDSESGLKSFM